MPGERSNAGRERMTQPDLVIHQVVGIDELSSDAIASADRVVSILGACAKIPPLIESASTPVLNLRFDDIVAPEAGLIAPTKRLVRQLLAFDAEAQHSDRLLVHCTAGISRSTAALVTLLAARHPELDDELFAALREIRPRAWPNSLVVSLADELLDRKGSLIAALRRHYVTQCEHPELGRMFRTLSRESEVPLDLRL